MSRAAALDVRVPIGALFTALGLLLAGYGLMRGSEPAAGPWLSPVNLNLWWGLVMLWFGLLLLLAARLGRRRRSAQAPAETADGRATEEREHRLGLER